MRTIRFDRRFRLADGISVVFYFRRRRRRLLLAPVCGRRVLCFGNHGRFTLLLFGLLISSHCDDDCVPFGNFTFNKMDGCRKSNRLLLSLRFCRSIKSTNENKRNDQFPIKRVANACHGMRCVVRVRTQQIHCWSFGHIE